MKDFQPMDYLKLHEVNQIGIVRQFQLTKHFKFLNAFEGG